MTETSPIPLRIVANAPFSLLEWIWYLHRIMRVACALETSLCAGKMLEVLWLWLFHHEIALFIHHKLLFHHRQCWQQLRSNKSLSFHFVGCCTNRKMLSDYASRRFDDNLMWVANTLIGEKNCTPNQVEKFFPVIFHIFSVFTSSIVAKPHYFSCSRLSLAVVVLLLAVCHVVAEVNEMKF